jgi:hypothetical protein
MTSFPMWLQGTLLWEANSVATAKAIKTANMVIAANFGQPWVEGSQVI